MPRLEYQPIQPENAKPAIPKEFPQRRHMPEHPFPQRKPTPSEPVPSRPSEPVRTPKQPVPVGR